MDYWGRKEELKKHAREWYDKMQTEYADEIKKSIEGTVEYAGRPDVAHWVDIQNTCFILMQADTVSALMKCDKAKACRIAVLNYASYKHPGGAFFDGSSAQEESLCHESTLANVITDGKFADYYNWNRKHLNFALYLDRALYSPDILFIKDGKQQTADVITCAAPNWKACNKYHPEKEGDNILALDDRTLMLRRICKVQGINTFITGAWGCGVFGQDPAMVCDYFITNFSNSEIRYVIFAVPDEETFQTFKRSGGERLTAVIKDPAL